VAQKKKDIILLGKEATRGTVAGSFPLQLPFMGDGLVPTLTDHLGRVMSSSTWPYDTVQVPVGVTAALALTPDLNIGVIRDLITAITKRTAGDMPQLSIKHSRAGVSGAQYLGCVISAANIEYSRSGSPDGSALLQGSINLECMSATSGATVVAGTAPTGHYFRLQNGTFTVNGSTLTKVLSYRRSWTIAHALGPPDSTNIRLYLEDGELEETITLVAQFTAAALSDLVFNQTEHAVTIVHATGTATETLTETIAKAQVETHTLGVQDGTTTEEITIKPYYGSTDPTVWTFGAGIPAATLSL
jgi:tail tube protein